MVVAKNITISEKFDQLLNESRMISFKSGEPILYQGEVPRSAYYIVEGQIKVFDIGLNGDEKIVTFSSAGEFIPPAWVFNKSPVSLYYYDAFTDCKVRIMSRQRIRETIDSDEFIARTLFDRYMGLYTGMVQHINALAQSKGVDKILYILQLLAMRFGRSLNHEDVLIAIRLTHQDIASMAGLTRETTSVELHKLKKSGVIHYQDQHYVINPKKLQAMLGSDEFNNYSY